MGYSARNIRQREQLGEHHMTAYQRMVKDCLFEQLTQNGVVCFRCGEKMTRNTFSIDHIDNWENSEDPRTKFFDQENIAYSHKRCNSAAGSGKKGSKKNKYVPGT